MGILFIIFGLSCMCVCVCVYTYVCFKAIVNTVKVFYHLQQPFFNLYLCVLYSRMFLLRFLCSKLSEIFTIKRKFGFVFHDTVRDIDCQGDFSDCSHTSLAACFFVEIGDCVRYSAFSLPDLEFFWQNNLEVYQLAIDLFYIVNEILLVINQLKSYSV